MSTTKDKVYQKLLSQEWVDTGELEDMFPRKTEGHQSFMQRLRQIRAELRPLGGGVIKRRKYQHTYEYHLVKPEQGQMKFY